MKLTQNSIVCMLLFLSFQTQGQINDLPETGSAYTYTGNGFFSGFFGRFNYQWEEDGANFNDTLYSTLESGNDTYYVRSEGDQWFVRNEAISELNQTEFLLYDWSVQVGDTIQIGAPLYVNDVAVVTEIVIDSITVFTDLMNTERNQYFFSNITVGEDNIQGTWIEGVGVLSSFFILSAGDNSFDNYFPLICAEISSDLIYENDIFPDDHEYENCNWNETSISELYNDVKIYPIPANEDLFIVCDYSRFKKAFIHNSTGSMIMEYSVSENHHSLDVRSLAKGVYFLRLVGDYDYNHQLTFTKL